MNHIDGFNRNSVYHTGWISRNRNIEHNLHAATTKRNRYYADGETRLLQTKLAIELNIRTCTEAAQLLGAEPGTRMICLACHDEVVDGNVLKRPVMVCPEGKHLTCVACLFQRSTSLNLVSLSRIHDTSFWPSLELSKTCCLLHITCQTPKHLQMAITNCDTVGSRTRLRELGHHVAQLPRLPSQP